MDNREGQWRRLRRRSRSEGDEQWECGEECTEWAQRDNGRRRVDETRNADVVDDLLGRADLGVEEKRHVRRLK